MQQSLFNAKTDYDVVANQAKAILSVRNGKVIMRRQEDQVEFLQELQLAQIA